MAKRRTAEQWSVLVGRWQQSGLSAKEFAKAEGLVASTLSWWSSRLRAKKPASKKGAPVRAASKKAQARRRAKSSAGAASVGLVELVTRGAVGPSEGGLELVVGAGVVIRVRRGFDEETLRRLLAVFAGESGARC